MSCWRRSHDDEQAEAWLEAAEDELDLNRRIDRILEVESPLKSVEPEGGPWPEMTLEEARREAISEREFERGEKALTAGKHDVALQHLRPLAERGRSNAQFYMGVMCAKGLGVPRDNIQAYVWLALAARTQLPRMWRRETRSQNGCLPTSLRKLSK